MLTLGYHQILELKQNVDLLFIRAKQSLLVNDCNLPAAPTQTAVNNFIFEASLVFEVCYSKWMILEDKVQFLCDLKKPLRDI